MSNATGANSTAPNTLTDGTLGTLPTKILTHGASGSSIEVTIKGATPLTWKAPFRGELGDFLAGFVSEEDFLGQGGMRGSLLFPFANRLHDNKYTWDGVTYDVPKQWDTDPEVIHGFVRLNDWDVESVELDSPDYAAITFGYAIRQGEYEWYPFDLDVRVRYELTATEFNVEFSYTNVGSADAPAGFGWHPYFRVPGHETFDDLRLRVPGRTRVLMDEKLVPLPGEAAYERREDDLIHEPLAGVNYDDAWADLVPDSDGLIRTTLTEPDTGAGVAMWQDRGTVLIYTGGSYPVPRGSIAIEPVESTTDAFNRPDRDAEVRLAPGATRTFKFGGTVLE